MALIDEIKQTRKQIVTDGYDMSIGEVMNLYKDGELIINPAFQRLFRWDISQKTRFIESILLGIPIPPIFVFQNEKGLWELVDGLQRLSTILEFSGELKNKEGEFDTPSILEGTNFLPGLSSKRWKPSLDADGNEQDDGIGKELQIEIKRARIRVEILKKESDVLAKYELFQRLNTGGSDLSPQEVRNCVAVMINKDFYDWLKNCSENSDFVSTIDQTEDAIKKQMAIELVLRFFAFRLIPYDRKLDVHEYLDMALIELAKDETLNMEEQGQIFNRTFLLLNQTLGRNTFKKWNGEVFSGKFLQSLFEVIATSVAINLERLEQMEVQERNNYIINRARSLWEDATFIKSNGAGLRGTTRLANLLPLANTYFNGEA